MAIEIPQDWPARTWSEDTLLANLETIDADAPDGTDPTRWKVSQWSTTREIQSSALPGQVRHRTGLSIGTGSALVKREERDFPWKHSLVYELTGQDAQILLAPGRRVDNISPNNAQIPTGQFQVAGVSGTLTSLGVQVELDEKTIDGKDKTPGVLDQQWDSGITQEEINAQEKDPVWLVSELAEQMGFRAGPNVAPGEDGYNPILDVPLQGALVPREPLNVPFQTFDTISWGSSEGVVGLSTEDDNIIDVLYEVGLSVPEGFTLTFDLSDRWGGFEWNDISTNGRFGVQVEAEAGSDVSLVIYSTGYNGVGNTVTNVGPLDITRNPDIPNRIQVEVGLTAGSEFSWNTASVRVRREEDAWFGPFVHAMPNGVHRQNEHNIDMQVFKTGGAGTAILSNYSVVDHSNTSSAVRDSLVGTVGGDQGRIYLEPLFGTITSPWLDPDLSVWSTIRAIVEAWQGAIVTDVYGNLKVLNRFTLTGSSDLQQERVVDIGLRFEDLPWEMNWADQADRLTVKYRPVDQVIASPSQTGLPTVYSFEDILIVWPGDNEYFFTLDYIYPLDLLLHPFIRKDSDNGFRHVWDAYRYNNGSGAHIDPDADISVSLDRVTSATWKVLISNLTAEPFHMVDETGTPYLKLRSSWYYDQTQEATIERGVAATDSKTGVEVDLGHYVQNADDANTLADFIWGRVNQRSWKVKTAVSIPDYRLDLGDVIEIRHSRTGVKSNALVTRVELDGESGRVGQKIDLLLIPPTWEDFDEAWAQSLPNNAWGDFDALWNTYTWVDFDRTPTATTVAEIEGAM